MSTALAEPARRDVTPAGTMTPADMLAVAVQQGADIGKLEKLMELQERWEKNQARRAFDEAMAAAKAKIKPIVKNRLVDFASKGGKTNYAYEDFAQVAACVDPALSDCGLSYRFRSRQEGKTLTVTCVLSHRGGHSEETSLSAPNDESGNKNSIQSIGSAATYLQRYTLKLALGLSAGLDDDAQNHGRHRSEPAEPEPAPAAEAKPARGMLAKEVAGGVKELARLKGVEPATVEGNLLGMVNKRFQGGRKDLNDCDAGELGFVADSVRLTLRRARAEAEAGTATAPLPKPDPHPTLDREPGIDPEDDEPEEETHDTGNPVGRGAKLPPATCELVLHEISEAGLSWPAVQGQLPAILGRAVPRDAPLAALSLDEAQKLRDWVSARAKEKAKKPQPAGAPA